MKKIVIVIVTCLVGAFTLQAQDFKPTEGSQNLEFQFAPLGGSPINISGIRYRKFSSTQDAFRVNAFLGVTRKSEITQEKGDNNRKRLVDRESSVTFNIRPGIEKHFEGTDRLSPYYGGELDLGYTRTVESSMEQIEGSSNVVKRRRINGKPEASWQFGINALAGFDYYIAKHLYLGAELGFGIMLVNPLATRIKSNADGFKEPDPSKLGKSPELRFGPNVNSAIRLGYMF
jgi:hypothetical protein